jgi:CRP-like cAMP-binding protein
MDTDDDIMKLAFQAEDAIDASVIDRFGRRFRDKQVIIREGDIQQKIFWVLEGEVYVTRRVGDKYKVLTTLGKGEIIGEMSFFDKSVRSATVIARETCTCSSSPARTTPTSTPRPQWAALVSLASVSGDGEN